MGFVLFPFMGRGRIFIFREMELASAENVCKCQEGERGNEGSGMGPKRERNKQIFGERRAAKSRIRN